MALRSSVLLKAVLQVLELAELVEEVPSRTGLILLPEMWVPKLLVDRHWHSHLLKKKMLIRPRENLMREITNFSSKLANLSQPELFNVRPVGCEDYALIGGLINQFKRILVADTILYVNLW